MSVALLAKADFKAAHRGVQFLMKPKPDSKSLYLLTKLYFIPILSRFYLILTPALGHLGITGLESA